MISLNVVGDIMLAQKKVGEQIELKGVDYIFDNVRNFLTESDFTIGNLECSLSDKGVVKDIEDIKFVFRASPDCARALKAAGFNILCLANNHILDCGPSALADTIYNLKNNDIYFMGAGNNIDDARRPLILEKDGLRIAFLAFTYSSKAKKRKPGCSPCDPKFMQKQIKSIKRNVDLVIVSIHDGVEYVDYPNRYLISLFRGVVDAGAALVIGHHPHVVQGVEIYKGSLIAYSLGNFLSSFINEEVRKEHYENTALSFFTDHPPSINDMRPTESMILHCHFNRKGIEDYKLIQIKSNDELQPVLMDGNDSATFLKRVEEISGKFSNLKDPVWDQMDNLWEKCKMHKLKKISFGEIIKRIHHIRLKHFELAVPYIKSKLRR